MQASLHNRANANTMGAHDFESPSLALYIVFTHRLTAQIWLLVPRDMSLRFQIE